MITVPAASFAGPTVSLPFGMPHGIYAQIFSESAELVHISLRESAEVCESLRKSAMILVCANVTARSLRAYCLILLAVCAILESSLI